MQQNMYKIYEENYNNLDKQSQRKTKKKKKMIFNIHRH